MIDELRLPPDVEDLLFERYSKEIKGISEDDMHKIAVPDYIVSDEDDDTLLWVGKDPWSRAFEGYANICNAPEWLLRAFLTVFNSEWRAKQAGILNESRRHFNVRYALEYVIRVNEAEEVGGLRSCSTTPMLGRLLALYCPEAYDARFFSLHRIPETDIELVPELYEKMTATGTISENEVEEIGVA